MKRFFLLLTMFLAILYREAFFARFFQDDFLLLQLAKSGDIFRPIANFPYRPISIQIFYRLGLFLFGENPFGFHLLLFGIFIGALWFAFLLAKAIFKDDFKAIITVIIFAFNVSLFALFYWVAVSYFVLAAFFVFSSGYFFTRGKMVLSLILFVLGLLSNELVILMPLLLLSLKLVTPIKITNIRWYAVISLVFLILRSQIASLPQTADYTLDFSLRAIATAKWYLLRVFNLPEGRAAAGLLVYTLFGLSVGTLLLAIKNFQIKFAAFGIVWFVVGALPFFFLPSHMSAYYLTISLFGPAVFISSLLGSNRKLVVIFLIFYLSLTVIGLNALSKTHWVILKL